MLFIAQSNYLYAQHIQYSDKKKPVISKTKTPVTDSVVYHQWPDKCPAISGSIPVLANYVPREMVLKLTEIYKGHLYSITSLVTSGGKLQYKLQVCVKGTLTFEYADENGVVR